MLKMKMVLVLVWLHLLIFVFLSQGLAKLLYQRERALVCVDKVSLFVALSSLSIIFDY